MERKLIEIHYESGIDRNLGVWPDAGVYPRRHRLVGALGACEGDAGGGDDGVSPRAGALVDGVQAEDRNRRSGRFYRLANEVPTLLMIGIVVMVMVRPF